DGSTYATTPPNTSLTVNALARASEGQVYPPRWLSSSARPADEFTVLNRASSGLRVADQAPFGGAGVLIKVALFTGTFQTLGAVATIKQPKTRYPDLAIPASTWPAFTYAPSALAVNGALPDNGLLSVLLKPLAGNDFSPQAELIVTNRSGQS